MDNKRKIGEEELKRALLMMKYDSRKTLSENVETVGGQQRLDEVIGTAALIAWIIGGAAATAGITSWIDSVTGGGDSFEKTRLFLNGCSTMLQKMKPTNSTAEIKSAAATIWENSAGQSWYQGFGSGNEESIRSAIDSMKTVADVCALQAEFYKTYSRDFYETLDSEIDGDDFITYVWVPISNKVEEADNQLQQAQEQQSQDNQQGQQDSSGSETITPAPSIGKYKDCSGTYTQGCYSEKIKEIQTCLSLVPDGKYGPKTQAALEGVGFTGGFKDSDVDTICNATSMPEPDMDLPTPDDDIDTLN